MPVTLGRDPIEVVHLTLPKEELPDDIRLTVVPRRRTRQGALIGWTTDVRMQFWHKGFLYYETFLSDYKEAALRLGTEILDVLPLDLHGLRVRDRTLCGQPGCPETHVNKYTRKMGLVGNALEPIAGKSFHIAFCNEHSRRGEGHGDTDDFDDNYELVAGPGYVAPSPVSQEPDPSFEPKAETKR